MMTVKISSTNEKKQKLLRVQNELKNLLGHKILDEVPEFKQKIQELLLEAEKVTFKNNNTQMLEGKIFSVNEILEMIIESSEYTKWDLSYTQSLNQDAINDLKQMYDIDFKEKVIKQHVFGRSTRDKDTVGTIIVTTLPGLFQVDLQTSNVGYSLKGLVNEKQFEQSISLEC